MITIQPSPLELTIPGRFAIFTVTATGNQLLYQWQKNGIDIAGATSCTHAIKSVTESDEGEYSCVVSNDADCVTSTAAFLAVCE